MIALGEKQITGVLVEGGAALLGSLCDKNLVDKAIVFRGAGYHRRRESPYGNRW